MTTDAEAAKEGKICVLCKKPLEGELVKYTDGTHAHQQCADDLQEYSADIAGEGGAGDV
jgi:hypothetical protein